MFLTSINTKVGHHIKELDLKFLNHKYNFHPGLEVLLIDTLSLCPSIKRLTVGYIPEIVNGLLSDKMPVLKSLKMLSFDKYYLRNQPDKTMDCYYKFKSSLTHLNLLSVITASKGSISQMIPSYLQSFSLLTDLTILSGKAEARLHLFDAILINCPHLSHLVYRDLTSHRDIYNTSSDTYPQLKNLKLRIPRFDSHYTRYIRKKLTGLTQLVFDIYHFPHDWKEYVLDDIIACKPLEYYQINMQWYWITSDLFKQFVTQFIAYPSDTINEIECIPEDVGLDRITFTHDKYTRTKSISLPLHYPLYSIGYVFVNMGFYFDTLKIITKHIHRDKVVYNYQTINEVFPRISCLGVDDIERISIDGLTIPNYNMKTLKVGKARVSDSWFRSIEIGYPSLKYLVLSLNGKYMASVDYTRGQFQLPNTGITSLTLNCPMRVRRHMVIIKYIDGCTVKVWSYNYRTKRVTIAENDEAESVVRMSPVKRRVTMVSNTIENVILAVNSSKKTTIIFIHHEMRRGNCLQANL
ncbi:hypothetical protein BDB01DRAFT_814399 [Pilobolus umbonatus]|nr:hypothetical protein BDB01DRAFT_814399 [Pilobolus umbonatus]